MIDRIIDDHKKWIIINSKKFLTGPFEQRGPEGSVQKVLFKIS